MDLLEAAFFVEEGAQGAFGGHIRGDGPDFDEGLVLLREGEGVEEEVFHVVGHFDVGFLDAFFEEADVGGIFGHGAELVVFDRVELLCEAHEFGLPRGAEMGV